MIASRDYRLFNRARAITLTMSLSEYREHVEWLEFLAPEDGCTRDWRAWLDDLDPPATDNESELSK